MKKLLIFGVIAAVLIVSGGIGVRKGMNMGTSDTSITTGTIQINGGGGVLLNTFGETGTLFNCHLESYSNMTLTGGGGDSINVNYIKIGNRSNTTDKTFKILHFNGVTTTIVSGGSTLTCTIPTEISSVAIIQGTFIYNDGTSKIGKVIIDGTSVVMGSDLDGSNFTSETSVSIHPFSISYN